MREVPHFSEHKSSAVGTQTPSHLLCQEKTHQDAFWKSVGPSGSFGCPSHKKNKSLSFSASLDSLARSLARTSCSLTNPAQKSTSSPEKGETPPSSLLPSDPSSSVFHSTGKHPCAA